MSPTRALDSLIWFFGKPYWWSVADGRLALQPALWALPDPNPATFTDWSSPDVQQAVLADIRKHRHLNGCA